EGHGLGHEFLRHVERCSALLHLVDLSTNEQPDVDAQVVARELELHSQTLAGKPRLVCGSKLDSAIPGNSRKLRAYAKKHGYEYHEISAVTGDGVRELVRKLASIVKSASVIPSREDGEESASLFAGDPSLRSGSE